MLFTWQVLTELLPRALPEETQILRAAEHPAPSRQGPGRGRQRELEPPPSPGQVTAVLTATTLSGPTPACSGTKGRAVCRPPTLGSVGSSLAGVESSPCMACGPGTQRGPPGHVCFLAPGTPGL